MLAALGVTNAELGYERSSKVRQGRGWYLRHEGGDWIFLGRTSEEVICRSGKYQQVCTLGATILAKDEGPPEPIVDVPPATSPLHLRYEEQQLRLAHTGAAELHQDPVEPAPSLPFEILDSTLRYSIEGQTGQLSLIRFRGFDAFALEANLPLRPGAPPSDALLLAASPEIFDDLAAALHAADEQHRQVLSDPKFTLSLASRMWNAREERQDEDPLVAAYHRLLSRYAKARRALFSARRTEAQLMRFVEMQQRLTNAARLRFPGRSPLQLGPARISIVAELPAGKRRLLSAESTVPAVAAEPEETKSAREPTGDQRIQSNSQQQIAVAMSLERFGMLPEESQRLLAGEKEDPAARLIFLPQGGQMVAIAAGGQTERIIARLTRLGLRGATTIASRDESPHIENRFIAEQPSAPPLAAYLARPDQWATSWQPPLSATEYRAARERTTWNQEQARQHGISELVPWPMDTYPFQPGEWVLEDRAIGWGREIEQLREIDPETVTVNKKVDHSESLIEQFAAWMHKGYLAPPVTVVIHASGTPIVVDGKKRWLAALRAKRRILAWFSDSVWAAPDEIGGFAPLCFELVDPRAAYQQIRELSDVRRVIKTRLYWQSLSSFRRPHHGEAWVVRTGDGILLGLPEQPSSSSALQRITMLLEQFVNAHHIGRINSLPPISQSGWIQAAFIIEPLSLRPAAFRYALAILPLEQPWEIKQGWVSHIGGRPITWPPSALPGEFSRVGVTSQNGTTRVGTLVYRDEADPTLVTVWLEPVGRERRPKEVLATPADLDLIPGPTAPVLASELLKKKLLHGAAEQRALALMEAERPAEASEPPTEAKAEPPKAVTKEEMAEEQLEVEEALGRLQALLDQRAAQGEPAPIGEQGRLQVLARRRAELLKALEWPESSSTERSGRAGRAFAEYVLTSLPRSYQRTQRWLALAQARQQSSDPKEAAYWSAVADYVSKQRSASSEPRRAGQRKMPDLAARAAKLRSSADSLQVDIDQHRGRGRSDARPTTKRVEQWAGAEERAQFLELVQSKMRALAEALEQQCPPEVLSELDTLEHTCLPAPLERVTSRGVIEDLLSQTKLPLARIQPDELDLLRRFVADQLGDAATSLLTELRSRCAAAQPGYPVFCQPATIAELDALAELEEKAAAKLAEKNDLSTSQRGTLELALKQTRRFLPALRRSFLAGLTDDTAFSRARQALLALGKPLERTTDTELEALRIKRAVNMNPPPGYVPTPLSTARKVVADADIQPGQRVLEPSAGSGNLAAAIREAGVEPDVIEVNPDLRQLLALEGYQVVGEDFLAFNPSESERYDRIVMNPPFDDRRDIKHVRHAFDVALAPGGRLAAIVSTSSIEGSGAQETAFRTWLDQHGADYARLPEDTFAQSDVQKHVQTSLIVLSKPLKAIAPPRSARPEEVSTEQNAAEAKDAQAVTPELSAWQEQENDAKLMRMFEMFLSQHLPPRAKK